MYQTEIAHSAEMKSALKNTDTYDQYRSAEISKILDAAGRYGIQVSGRRIGDLGCNDGAISLEYLRHGASAVVGIDIDEAAIRRAGELRLDDRLTFVQSTTDSIPLDDQSLDVVIGYDVFEHVSRPRATLKELGRILRPAGQVLIGTCGWFHPFAPHLWAVMPVPWAHVLFSERTLLRVCRRVYHAPWYVPNMHDYGADGKRLPDKYFHEVIAVDYLNKLLIRDFEKAFRASGFACESHLVPFGSRFAKWTRVLLRVPWMREFVTGYVWFVLTKEGPGASS